MASRIRRKPQVTYKSPSAEDRMNISSSLTYSRGSSPSTSTKRMKSSNSSDKGHQKYDIRSANRRRYSITPSLPLFHPFGRLAMSLPPLDPTRYGLPMLSIPDEIEPKSSLRTRRPAAKLREVEDEPPTSSAVSTIAAVAAQEVKDRPSPRKRRAGGAKRKRKDPDDADATYPAKRTRIPRGVGGQGIDDDSVVDGTQPDEAEPVPDMVPDLSDSAKRRSARAKGSLKRRDSSASETTSISGSANVASGKAGPSETTSPANADTARKSDGAGVYPLVVNDDKEEGELSEEHPGTS